MPRQQHNKASLGPLRLQIMLGQDCDKEMWRQHQGLVTSVVSSLMVMSASRASLVLADLTLMWVP